MNLVLSIATAVSIASALLGYLAAKRGADRSAVLAYMTTFCVGMLLVCLQLFGTGVVGLVSAGVFGAGALWFLWTELQLSRGTR
jgi:K+ transporter